MEFYEIMLVLAFLGYIGVFGYKLYNIFLAGDMNNYPKIFLGFIGGLFAWGVLFVITLVNFENLTAIVLMRLSSWMLPFLFLLTFVETMLQFSKFPTIPSRKGDRYVSNNMIGSK